MLYELTPAIKQYDWGKPREESIIASLTNKNSLCDFELPYAELWMGTHTSGMCYGKETSVPLTDLMYDIPFLFKILTIKKPLSIQVHPDQEKARVLHAQSPQYFPDDNHKPEMCIALTNFDLLYGFCNRHTVIENIQLFPSLYNFLQQEGALETFTFNNCLDYSEAYVQQLINVIVNDTMSSSSIHPRFAMTKNLLEYYPNDVGVLLSLFMNYIQLNPGESVFIPANIVHSYISGDAVECMAKSDNVIRCGLTSKHRSVEDFRYVVTSFQETPVSYIYPITNYGDHYIPPISSFSVRNIKSRQSALTLNTHSLLINLSGKGTLSNKLHKIKLEKGTVIFCAKLDNALIDGDDLNVWIASL